MNVSLICACKNRYDALKISLNSWTSFDEIKEIIIVDWTSDEPIDHLVKLDSRIKILRVDGEKYFNLAQPLNLAASCATGDYIIKVDCDYIINPYHGFFENYRIDDKSFLSGNGALTKNYEYLDERGNYSLNFKNLSIEEIAEYCNSYNHFFKFLKGLLYVSRDNFSKVGGYDEDITDYGWEDTDILSRLELLNLEHKKITYDHNLIHIPHSDRKRFENSPNYTLELENHIKFNLSEVYPEEEVQGQVDYVITQRLIDENKFISKGNPYIKPKTEWNIEEVNSQVFLCTKIVSKKLNNFPTVYYLSLEESVNRQESIERQFKKYNIDPKSIISKRFKDSDDVVTGKYIDQLLPGTIGCAVSHLKAIKEWYNTTNEDYAFFCEDDLSLETIKYWDFTWSDFMNTLPNDWECVQLLYLKNNGDISSLELKEREWDDWAVTAYIMTRNYAKKVIDSYCVGNTFNLELKDSEVMPLVETLFYSLGRVYSIPLFAEDCSLSTTFVQCEEHNQDLHDSTHKRSYDKIIQLWKDKKMISVKKIVDYFPFFAPTGKEMLELRVTMLKDYVDEFVICESNRTQSGVPIEYELENIIDELELPKDKIRIIKLNIPDDENLEVQEIDHHNCYDGNSSNVNSLRARARERMQKDALLSVLENYGDDTVFIHSDSDEIVKPDCINYISSVVRSNLDIVIRIPIVHLEGRADLRVYMKDTNQPKEWTGMFFATKTHLQKATPTQIRSNVFNPFPINFLTENGQVLQDLGWHFSWMGSPEVRKAKCKAFTHYDDKFSYLTTSKYGSDDTKEFQDTLDIGVGSIAPSGDKNTVLREYYRDNLPNEIFTLPRVKKFLFTENSYVPKKNKPKSFIIKSKAKKIEIIKEHKNNSESEICELLTKYSLDTENAEHNFNLGVWYEDKGHTAPALTYFLRCAERSENKDLAYEALIRGSYCYEKQGTRDGSSKSLLQQALVFYPQRPEAYYLLSRFSEKREWWQDCYIYANQALTFASFDHNPLKTDVEYPGKFGLLIQKIVSGWTWGKVGECKELLFNLRNNYDLPDRYKAFVEENIQKMGFS
jgi:hypothetical protein